jgi:hypothetical protein
MRRKVDLKTIFIVANIAVLLWALFSFMANPEDYLAFGVVVCLNLLNILFFKVAFDQNNNFLKLYAFYFLHWYLLRLPWLLWRQDDLRFNDYLSFAPEDFLKSLFFLLAYHFFSGFLLVLVGKKCSLNFNSRWRTQLDRDFSPVFYWFLMVELIFLFLFYKFRMCRGGDVSSFGFLTLMFGRRFPLEFLSFLILFNFPRFSKNLKIKAIIFVSTFAALHTFTGGRSAVYLPLIL